MRSSIILIGLLVPCLVGCRVQPNAVVVESTDRMIPPIRFPAAEPESPVSHLQNQLSEVNSLIESLKTDHHNLITELEKTEHASDSSDPIVWNISKELQQIKTYIDLANKKRNQLIGQINKSILLARKKARQEKAKGIIPVPELEEEGITEAVEIEASWKSAMQEIKQWQEDNHKAALARKQQQEALEEANRKKEAQNTNRKVLEAKINDQAILIQKQQETIKEINKVALDKQQALEEAKAALVQKQQQEIQDKILKTADQKAAIETQKVECKDQKLVPVSYRLTLEQQWDDWWNKHVQRHKAHPGNCSVYYCKKNNIFWSYCPYSLKDMFPNLMIVNRSGGGYEVIPTTSFVIYAGKDGWGFIPNRIHGYWCPYPHP